MFPATSAHEGRIDTTAWEGDSPIPPPPPTPPGYFEGDWTRRALFDHEFGAELESVPAIGAVS